MIIKVMQYCTSLLYFLKHACIALFDLKRSSIVFLLHVLFLFLPYDMTQIGTQNSLELIEDPKAEAVEEMAAKLGLRKVRDLFHAS